jgi:tRNA pseudouridine38-40 synthase
MTRTFRCVIQYDGTAFAGFQRQPGVTTVQGVLEAALARVTQQQVGVMGAGRTDAGVHAIGQVAHFESASALALPVFQRAINACLPAGIVVRDLEEAPPGFHARFSARSREYRYVVDNAAVPSPLLRDRVHHVGRPLSVAAMAEGAKLLEGMHDFAAFGSPMMHSAHGRTADPAEEVRGSTSRTMFMARCWRRGHLILFCFIADAFLRHMVRMIVGTLLRVGAGSLIPDAVRRLLQGDSSLQAGPAAPAYGLYLVHVRY